MDAKTIRYEPGPFVIAVGGIIALELFAGGAFAGDAIRATGLTRLMQAAFLLGLMFLFGNQAGIAGVSLAGIKRGVRRGLLWSAGFGCAAAVAGIVMAAAGINPIDMIGIRLPAEKSRLVMFFIVAAFIGPVAEELFFRGVVYGFLRRAGVAAAILGSSAVFIMAHSTGGIAVTHLVGALVFAVAYEYEKNITVPVTIHVLGNLALFSTAFLG